MARQPDEVWGVVLLVVGVLLVLGVHLDVLGLVGGFLRRWLAAGLGWGADMLPAGFVVGGVALLVGRTRRGGGGIVLCLLVTAIGAAGLADLASGLPSGSAPLERLGGAGGVFGAEIGTGLHALLGMVGAAIVLGVACLVAAGAAVGISARAAVASTRAALASLGRAADAYGEGRREVTEEAATEPGSVPARAAKRTAVIDWPLDDEGADDAGSGLDEALLGEDLVAHDLVAGNPLGGSAGAPGGHGELEAAVEDLLEDGGLGSLEAPTRGDLSGAAPAGLADEEPPRAPTAGGSVAPGGAHQLGLGIVPPPSPWRLPPARLLARSKEQGLDRRAVEERGKALERALGAHGVDTHLAGFTVGPTVTRFELELGAGVKVARVTSLAKDIAYAMASPDVRILAPIPGRSAIGVEVPNQDRQLVTLGDVLTSPEARRASHPLEVALGRDIAGRAVMANLAEMPHLLIAGATGAGKSSCINSVITSILMRSTPEQVRLILIDPKRVELGQYNGLPHLLTQVVVNPKRAANALSWAVAEMERRYDLLAEVGMRDVTGYNAAVDRGDFATGPFDQPIGELDGDEAAGDEADGDEADGDGADGDERIGADEEVAADGEGSTPVVLPPAAPSGEAQGVSTPSRFERLPFILVVVDELNDLMMVAARDVEESICRIAQMARAVGIHLVIATQRPSVDVITGVIKANVPSRLAFSVSSLADSRVILDQPGAERLVGRGDLLLLTASSSVPRRIQGPWVSEEEVRAVVAQWRRQSGPRYLDGVVGDDGTGPSAGPGGSGDDDDLLGQAMELVVRSQLGSTSMLQRKLRVGFARAGRLMDLLEQRGVVGPSEGSKARAVLMTPDELDSSPS